MNNLAYKKNLIYKISSSTNKSEFKKVGGNEYKNNYLKLKENFSFTPKNQSNPEYLFFESLRNILDPYTYKNLIKLLHLYTEGVLNHSEFMLMTEGYFSNNPDLYEYLKTLTYSKMMNRRFYSIINKPLSELDLTSILIKLINYLFKFFRKSKNRYLLLRAPPILSQFNLLRS